MGVQKEIEEINKKEEGKRKMVVMQMRSLER